MVEKTIPGFEDREYKSLDKTIDIVNGNRIEVFCGVSCPGGVILIQREPFGYCAEIEPADVEKFILRLREAASGVKRFREKMAEEEGWILHYDD